MSNYNIDNKIWFVWLPLGFLMIQACIELFVPGPLSSIIHSENGPHETVQFFLMVAGFIIALWTLINLGQKNIWLSAWVGLAAISCFYVAGEEISWGQHIFAWTTPEFWAGVNDQNETNLHNTSSWLDQKPRLILEIGIYIGGLLIPLIQKFKPCFLPKKFALLYPDKRFFVTALCVLVPKLVEKIGEMADLVIFTRVSEVQELYMFYFVLLYLISLRYEIHKSKLG